MCPHLFSVRVGGMPGFNARQSLLLVLGIWLIVTTCSAGPAHAQGNPLNGSSPRPFYVFAHNPNTITDVQIALDHGANALEPDITSAACGNADPLGNLVDWDSSFPHRAGRCSDTKLIDWLKGVHDLAINNVQLALIVFDIKSSAATAENGVSILKAIRDHLNIEGINLNVILSVATKDDLAVFSNILQLLGPREGVMVDAENDPGAVVNYFFERGYSGNIGYGDGTAGPGPNLFTAIDGAAFDRAAVGYPKAVPYVYTIDLEDSMKGFMDAGVDGIIPGDIRKLLDILHGRKDVRIATRQDNPFHTLNEAYGLKIRTGRDGTRANITFTLEGALGTASITVNTDRHGRMGSGDTNFVTLPSRNLGPLKSITVMNDGARDQPDWMLKDVTVYSAHWIKADLSYHYTATINDLVKGHSSRTLTFRLDEFVWASFASSSDGTLANPRKRIGDAYSEVAPGGIIRIAEGRYGEKLTLTKPCTLRFWVDHGAGPAVIGRP